MTARNGREPRTLPSDKDLLTAVLAAQKQASKRKPSVAVIVLFWTVPWLLGWLTIGIWTWTMVSGVWS